MITEPAAKAGFFMEGTPTLPLQIINTPGIYEFRQDYTSQSVSDDAIVVAPGVHNVHIVLYSRLACLATLPKNRQNAGIRLNGNNACKIIGMGGTIRGYGYGVSAVNCGNLEIWNLSVPDALMRGIRTSGANTLIQNCVVRNIFGSTFTPKQYCFGIETSGAAPKVLGNTVEEFYGTEDGLGDNGEGVGISCSDGGIDALVKGNACKNGTRQPKSYGFWLGGSFDGAVVHNYAENLFRGFAASSPTYGLFDENAARNCDQDFIDSEGDWLVGGMDG